MPIKFANNYLCKTDPRIKKTELTMTEHPSSNFFLSFFLSISVVFFTSSLSLASFPGLPCERAHSEKLSAGFVMVE